MTRLTLLILAVLALALGALAQTTTATAGPGTKTPTPPAVDATVKGAVKDFPATLLPADMVSITLVTDAGNIRVSLAPKGFLDKLGLTIANDAQLSVTGKQKTSKEGKVSMDAAIVTANGKDYVLREKGRPQWTMIDFAVLVTLDGTVSKLTTPDAATTTVAPATTTTGAAVPGITPTGQKQPAPKPVSFTLVADKGTYNLTIAPAEYLEKIGLTLKDDQKVSVSAWQVETTTAPRKVKGEVAPETGKHVELTVKSITVDGTVYSLRNDAGKALWEVKAPRTGGKRK